MRDTTLAAEEVRLAAVRQTEPIERLRQAFALSEAMRALELAGLRAKHPACSDRELVGLLLEQRMAGAEPHARIS